MVQQVTTWQHLGPSLNMPRPVLQMPHIMRPSLMRGIPKVSMHQDKCIFRPQTPDQGLQHNPTKYNYLQQQIFKQDSVQAHMAQKCTTLHTNSAMKIYFYRTHMLRRVTANNCKSVSATIL